jgi:hypothetical protein
MRNRLRIALLMFAVFGAALATSAQAIVLNVVATEPVVSVGSPITIQIRASEFGSSTTLPIGAFTLPLRFNTSLVALSSVQYGNLLNGGNPPDSIQLTDTSTPGVAVANEISLLAPDTLVLLDSLLATFLFDTLDAGLANFALDIDDPFLLVGDGNGDPLSLRFAPSATSVEIRAVPEPSPISLLALGVLALLGVARRKSVARV